MGQREEYEGMWTSHDLRLRRKTWARDVVKDMSGIHGLKHGHYDEDSLGDKRLSSKQETENGFPFHSMKQCVSRCVASRTTMSLKSL
jgi:hypothetical protein